MQDPSKEGWLKYLGLQLQVWDKIIHRGEDLKFAILLYNLHSGF